MPTSLKESIAKPLVQCVCQNDRPYSHLVYYYPEAGGGGGGGEGVFCGDLIESHYVGYCKHCLQLLHYLRPVAENLGGSPPSPHLFGILLKRFSG
jgi:hypothetical protein